MNPYTVLLLEKPSEAQQSLLLEQLQSKFRLNEAQAKVLAGRSSGHILKPTTQQKAQQIAQLYVSLGLKVEVVEVEPAPAPAAPAAPAPSRVVVRSSGVVVGSAVGEKPQVMNRPTPIPTPIPAPIPTTIPQNPAEPSRQRVHVVSDLSAPAFIPPAIPSAMLRPSPAPSQTSPPQAGSSTHTHTTASTVPPSSRNVVSGSGQQNPDPAPSSDPLFDPERATVVIEPSGIRRTSLTSRLLITTLLPLVLLLLSVVTYLSISLPHTLDVLLRQSANQLAASISNSVDLKDLGKTEKQLRDLASLPDIGFIRIASPSMKLFRSKFPDGDTQFAADFNTFLTANPKASQYAWTNNLGNALKTAMEKMKTSSSDPKRLAEMQTELDQAQLQAGQSTTFNLEQVGAYKWLGTIKIGPIVAPEGQLPPAFIVSVGVMSDSNRSLVWKQILAIVAVALLGLALATYFALRTSRRITQPILDLAEAADQISLGKMDYEIKVGRNDEIGDLAQALERMRVSLTSALERLRSRRR
jgi:HAMP domain-containing protein